MRYFWLVILAIFLLAACNGDDENSSSDDNEEQATATFPHTPLPPTWTPSPEGFVPTVATRQAVTTVPQFTPREGAGTLPPTWTPLPEGFVPGATATRRTSAQNVPLTPRDSQSTLPPTWTPAPTSTPRPVQQNQVISVTATPTLGTPEDICYLFLPDPGVNAGSESVPQNASATIFWNPIPLEGYTYRFRLRHPDGTILLEQEVSETQFEIPPEVLVAENQVYSWEVQPMKDGQITCFAATDEIFVQAGG